MKRKLMSLGLVVALSAAVLTGCTQASANSANGGADSSAQTQAETYVDGKYLVKTDVSDYGDLVLATLEVENGEIKSYEYREFLVDSGEAKSEENYGYAEGLQVVEDLNKQFNEKKNLDEVDFDALSGATFTKGNFKKVTEELLEMAKKGETYEPVYTDGVYEAVGEEAVYGWLPEVKVTVVEGQIVGINYVEKAVEDSEGVKAGDIKSEENYDYTTGLEVAKAVEKIIIDNNGVENLDLDSVTGATSTRDSVVALVTKALAGEQ